MCNNFARDFNYDKFMLLALSRGERCVQEAGKRRGRDGMRISADCSERSLAYLSLIEFI